MNKSTSIPVYFDYHATTPVDQRVASVVMNAMTISYGNPNSIEHKFGEQAAELINNARNEVSKLVNTNPESVFFTSGSTESIQRVIYHSVRSRKNKRLRVAVSIVEHRAVLDTIANYERSGEISVYWIPVDHKARIDIDVLEELCTNGVDLVCVMAANNEVGNIYPTEDIVRIASKGGAATLIDATQAVGKYPIQTSDWGITYLTLSAHKIYGPKGVGALVMSPKLTAQMSHGHILGTGPGTPNVPGIAGLGEACRLRRVEMTQDEHRITTQRDRLESLLLDTIDGLVINGDRAQKLGNNLHVSIPGVPNDAIIARLRNHIAISSGSACTSGAQTNSHVLQAMRLPEALQESALRIGIGKFTTNEEIEYAAEHISQAVSEIRDEMGI